MSTRGNIHIDQALTNFSLKYSNGAMIADLIAHRDTPKYLLPLFWQRRG